MVSGQEFDKIIVGGTTKFAIKGTSVVCGLNLATGEQFLLFSYCGEESARFNGVVRMIRLVDIEAGWVL